MRKWWPLVAICLGTFMLLVDVTIVNVALPSMAGGLHTSFASLQWVIDGYALALAALLLGVGSVADLVGLRRAYLAGLGVFAVASLVCGLAPGAGLLVGARVVQGVGGAAMFATTGALISSSYQGRDRGTAYGWWGAVSGAAAAVGPVIGGLLVQGLSWRWIFFVNLPISGIAIVMTVRYLRPDGTGSRRRPDLIGTFAFTAAASCLTYALIRAGEHGWATASTYLLMLAAAVSLAVFLVAESRSDHAMLDLALFRGRSFVGTMVAALLINFAAFAALTYSSIWLQTVLGLSPLQAGLTGLPLAATAFVVIGRHRPVRPRRPRSGHRVRHAADRRRQPACHRTAARRLELAGSGTGISPDRRGGRSGHAGADVIGDERGFVRALRHGGRYCQHRQAARVRDRDRRPWKRLLHPCGRRAACPAGR